MQKQKCFWIVIICLLTAGCSTRENEYENYFSFKGGKWTTNMAIPFEFCVDDTVHPYAFGLNFRYTTRFPYQDIYLFLQTTFPNGSKSIDTLHCELFTPEGEPVGKGHRIKELKINYSYLKFPVRGKYIMHFTQAMRTDSLEGIESFGMNLIKQESVQNIKSTDNGKQKSKFK